MEGVGVFEAKTHLARLLRQVEAGQRFLITRRDRPVAELIPATRRNREAIRKAIESMEDFRKTHDLGGESIVAMIREGRRRE